MSANKVFTIVGPTASGKTDVAFLIARLIKTKLNSAPEIISADSRQVYKYIPIASSYPPEEYLKQFKHHFIGELEPDEEFNAGEFGNRAREVIHNILSKKNIPIIAGGSGLYISSLIYGLFDYENTGDDELKAKQKSIRETLYKRLDNEGLEPMFKELSRVDGRTAEKMENVTPRRVIRALEVYLLTGIPLSTLQQKKIDAGFEAVQFGINWNRQDLYDRINGRADRMLEKGLIDEVKKLKEKGYDYKKYNSLNTVGIKEVFDYLNGQLDYESMVELIKRSTRRFAKRQMTWFRKDKKIKWIDLNSEADLTNASEKIFNSFFKNYSLS